MQLQLDAEALQTQSRSFCASTIFTLQLVLTEQLEVNLTVFLQSVRCVFRFAGVSGSNHHLLALLSFPVCCQPSKPEQEIHEKVLILSSKRFQDKNGKRMVFVLVIQKSVTIRVIFILINRLEWKERSSSFETALSQPVLDDALRHLECLHFYDKKYFHKTKFVVFVSMKKAVFFRQLTGSSQPQVWSTVL